MALCGMSRDIYKIIIINDDLQARALDIYIMHDLNLTHETFK